jgi:hypothetical protein
MLWLLYPVEHMAAQYDFQQQQQHWHCCGANIVTAPTTTPGDVTWRHFLIKTTITPC